MELTKVKVQGHRGTWYSITAGREFTINGKLTELYLFEHETYGGAAPHVIATKDGELFMENVWNGWDDWKEYVLEEQGYNRSLTIKEVISI